MFLFVAELSIYSLAVSKLRENELKLLFFSGSTDSSAIFLRILLGNKIIYISIILLFWKINYFFRR